ncbi:uncharacterized protein LOC112693471 [Sipha flava]|uniref:Uncharacterized protein LOC112693471 n=1 Tax=Sipha flava TaxID=143950 RepID=A0A8B8GMX7_9HEMI|nr:uncharacterized protein LOC112693471 [Sipha flava]
MHEFQQMSSFCGAIICTISYGPALRCRESALFSLRSLWQKTDHLGFVTDSVQCLFCRKIAKVGDRTHGKNIKIWLNRTNGPTCACTTINYCNDCVVQRECRYPFEIIVNAYEYRWIVFDETNGRNGDEPNGLVIVRYKYAIKTLSACPVITLDTYCYACTL